MSGMLLTKSRMFCAIDLHVDVSPIKMYMNIRFIVKILCFCKVTDLVAKNKEKVVIVCREVLVLFEFCLFYLSLQWYGRCPYLKYVCI